MMMKNLFLMLTMMLGVQAVSSAADPIKVTSVEGITEYRLENGLRVLLFPDQSKQTITVNITYLVGSRHENYGETGMAHLLEHMVFKGTPNHPNIPQELTEHGARPNGTTWLDRTNYYETFNATEDNLKWALELEADRMTNSYIAKKDLDSEMTVVRNEFESGENSPFSVLMERIVSTAYLWHNYGKSTIGCRADIENVPIERLQAFYHKYYQPDNAVLTVAGKFDPEKTLALINKYYSPIPRPERVLPDIYTLDPVQDGERFVSLRRVGDVQFLGCAYHAAPGPHSDFAAIEVLTSVLASNPSGRLYKAMVDGKKASQSFGWSFQLHDPGLMMFFAEVPKEKDLEDAKNTMLATLDAVVANPPTETEVEQAKNELLKNIELSFNSSERISLQLSEWIGMGDWRLMFIHRDRIKQVTADQVLKVAENYLKPDNRTVGIFIPTADPQRAEIPATPDVAALVKDYKGTETISEGEAFDPSPDNIDARTVTTTAKNGMEIALLPKKTRGESVNLSMTLRYGTEKSLMNKGKAGEYAIDLLETGTSKMNREEIKQAFDKLKATVRINGSSTGANVSITTKKENLNEVLSLVRDILRDPVFPQEELDKLIEQNLASMEQNRSEPQAIAVRAIQRHNQEYAKGHPNYVGTLDEELAEYKDITREEVVSFYKDFVSTANATVSVVGDFDQANMTQQLEELFGDWKAPQKYARIERPYRAPKPDNLSFETPDKANAFFIASLPMEMNDESADYAAVTMGNFMLGGGFLNSRLATRIRQKEGLSYGVGSFFNAGALDKSASWGAYAIYAPENAEKLEAAFKEEIQKVITEGFTAEELEAAKSGWLQSQTVSRSQDNRLAGSLNSNLFYDRTMAWDKALEEKVMNMKVEDINAAMKRNIDPSKITIIKAGDFAKVKAKTDKP
ncbi:MAG: insulinase family protein [Saprospiraceae bacterium]|nr:insulinase family protein [Saprospiraceae bacterium]